MFYPDQIVHIGGLLGKRLYLVDFNLLLYPGVVVMPNSRPLLCILADLRLVRYTEVLHAGSQLMARSLHVIAAMPSFRK